MKYDFNLLCFGARCLSLPVRGAWVEIKKHLISGSTKMSLPVRGAWVEIEMIAGR